MEIVRKNKKVVSFGKLICGGIYEITTNQGDVIIAIHIYDADLYYDLNNDEEAFVDLKDGAGMRFKLSDIKEIKVLQGSLVLDN